MTTRADDGGSCLFSIPAGECVARHFVKTPELQLQLPLEPLQHRRIGHPWHIAGRPMASATRAKGTGMTNRSHLISQAREAA